MTSRKRRLQLRRKRHTYAKRAWVKEQVYVIDYGALDEVGEPARFWTYERHPLPHLAAEVEPLRAAFTGVSLPLIRHP